jgi:acyl-coenzyme A synthetase/AMP-(fatty) acid ligase
MNSLVLLTSGTTKPPKKINHSWEHIENAIERSISEIGLSSKDIVLDVFPGNTIAHYTVTAMPAYRAGSMLISAKFEAIDYISKFNEYRPTYIALIPKHWELLKEHNQWKTVDMSCVRYMTTGSGKVPQEMIDDFLSKGVKLVANWYGMTEHPPPVLIGYNSEQFDLNPTLGYTIEFADDGECIINGFYTGDLFDVATKKFLMRKNALSNIKTWKNS